MSFDCDNWIHIILSTSLTIHMIASTSLEIHMILSTSLTIHMILSTSFTIHMILSTSLTIHMILSTASLLSSFCPLPLLFHSSTLGSIHYTDHQNTYCNDLSLHCDPAIQKIYHSV
jgi:hypothetical protein